MHTPPMPDDMRALVAMLPTARVPERLWRGIDARIRNGDVVLLPLDDRHVPRIRSRRFVAAAMVIVLASGAAAAIAYDALRDWTAERAAAERDAATNAPPASSEAPGTIAPVVLLIDPDASGQIRVELVRPASDLRLRLVLSPVPAVQVSASGPAATAQFRSRRGGIVIADAAGGELLLEIPRESASIEVAVDGRMLFSKRGASIRLTVPVDTSGAEFILPVR